MVRAAAARHYDLILMDLSMPTMDGFATCAVIRDQQKERKVPIIALTAHSAGDYRNTVLLAGMDDDLPARERGLGFPLVIRFQDLLRHRVESVNRAFHSAIGEFGYRNHYRGVFPIKVNQLREVIEEIVDAGQQFHFGLEAGSKPELIAALAMHKDLESLIVCNGYKDRAYIKRVIRFQRGLEAAARLTMVQVWS